MRFISLFLHRLHVDLNNIKPLNVAMEKQEWFLYALLLSYKTFRIALNNINVLSSPCKLPDIVVRI